MFDCSDAETGAFRLDPNTHLTEMRQYAAKFTEGWQLALNAKLGQAKDLAAFNQFMIGTFTSLCVLTGARVVNAGMSDLPYRISSDLSLILPADKDYSLIHRRRPLVVPTVARWALRDLFVLRHQATNWITAQFQTDALHKLGRKHDGRPYEMEKVQSSRLRSADAAETPQWFFFQINTASGFQSLRPILAHDIKSQFNSCYQARPSEFRVQLRHFLADQGASQCVITAVMGHNTLLNPNFGMNRWWTLRTFRDRATPVLDAYAKYLGFAVPYKV